MKVYFLSILFFFTYSSSYSQSCCSGGVPISNSLGLPISERNTFQTSIAFDQNRLNTLKERKKNIDDNSRNRLTNSNLLQMGYRWSKKWSAEVLISHIRQIRIIKQFGNSNRTKTSGIGDAVFLLKYDIISSQKRNFQFGLGTKLPTGRSDLKLDSGIQLNADLQPGSGSLDYLYWATYQYRIRNNSIFLTSTFSQKGKNGNYLGNEVYQFGHEYLSSLGYSRQVFLANQIGTLTGQIIYRNAWKDKINGIDTPGSGGEFVFLKSAVSFNINEEQAIHFNLSFPLYSFVYDTQLAPTLRWNVAYYFILNSKKNENSL